MFEQTFVDGVGKTNKTWTVLLSFVAQIAGIIVAIIIPLLFTDAIPKDIAMIKEEELPPASAVQGVVGGVPGGVPGGVAGGVLGGIIGGVPSAVPPPPPPVKIEAKPVVQRIRVGGNVQ